MDKHLESIYLGQAQLEFNACFTALDAFNSAISGATEDDPFVHAMTFVHRAAAASRIFWPPGGRRGNSQRSKDRGDHLLASLDINDNHPIKSRTLRDHFEHFDERLDEWAEVSQNRNIVGRLLGSRSLIGGDGIADTDIILHYDPTTKIFAFRGEKFDLQELASGISDLSSKVQTRLSDIDNQRFNKAIE